MQRLCQADKLAIAKTSRLYKVHAKSLPWYVQILVSRTETSLDVEWGSAISEVLGCTIIQTLVTMTITLNVTCMTTADKARW